MGERYPMWTRCHIQIQVEMIGAKFLTREECPAGVKPGIEINEFNDNHCIGCPKNVGPAKPKTKKKMPPKKKKAVEGITKVEGGYIVETDAVKLLKSLGDETIDLAIFDPAYASLEKHRKTGTTTRLKQSKGSSNKWFEIFPNSRYFELFVELYRVMKKGTHIYMFCDEETRDLVTCGYAPQTGEKLWEGLVEDGPPLIAAGFKYWKSIIWDKVHPGMGYHYRAQHEYIIMAEKVEKKGKHRRLNDAKPGDVIKCARLKGKQFYPTEKPAPVIWRLITQSSNEGDTCLDFFCGSGVTGQMARKTKRKFILGDIDTAEAVKRLS